MGRAFGPVRLMPLGTTSATVESTGVPNAADTAVTFDATGANTQPHSCGWRRIGRSCLLRQQPELPFERRYLVLGHQQRQFDHPFRQHLYHLHPRLQSFARERPEPSDHLRQFNPCPGRPLRHQRPQRLFQRHRRRNSPTRRRLHGRGQPHASGRGRSPAQRRQSPPLPHC